MRNVMFLLSFVLFFTTSALAEEKPIYAPPEIKQAVTDSINAILNVTVGDSGSFDEWYKGNFLPSALNRVDNPDDAIARLKELADQYPSSLRITYLFRKHIAPYHMVRLEFEEAKAVLEKAIEIQSAHDDRGGERFRSTRTLYAFVLIRFGRYEEAREIFANPKNSVSTLAYFTHDEYHNWFIPYCERRKRQQGWFNFKPKPRAEAYIYYSGGLYYEFLIDMIDEYYLGKEEKNYEEE